MLLTALTIQVWQAEAWVNRIACEVSVYTDAVAVASYYIEAGYAKVRIINSLGIELWIMEAV